MADIVIIKDDQFPPAKWPLARVLSGHTNQKDALVRSIDLKTNTYDSTRPIVKLLKLPIDEDVEKDHDGVGKEESQE